MGSTDMMYRVSSNRCGSAARSAPATITVSSVSTMTSVLHVGVDDVLVDELVAVERVLESIDVEGGHPAQSVVVPAAVHVDDLPCLWALSMMRFSSSSVKSFLPSKTSSDM